MCNGSKVITYDDLIKDPELMATMKSELDLEQENLNPSWKGKTLYELLKESNEQNKTDEESTNESENEKFSTANEHSPSPPPLQVLTVQHCQLEQSPRSSSSLISPPLGFSNEDKSKGKSNFVTQTLLDDLNSTSNLRHQERVDSSDNTDEKNHDLEGELLECCDLTENPDFDPGYLRYLDNPGFLTICYCLALMHQLGQLGGLDFLSTLGMVLAMISMMSMLFI